MRAHVQCFRVWAQTVMTILEPERFETLESIFHRARSLDPSDRAPFLDEACADDLELRSEVESLLTHADRTTDVLRPSTSALRDDATVVNRGGLAEGPGTRIGSYKILQAIGEGGFGVVYMAEQQQPVLRKVALKIIKLGMDTKQVIARFEAERQALAMMDHPNIARVLDAGATETGRPYFVMELVRGIPITQFCDERGLSMRERLQLLIQVCHAIQHAHHKGIIHRDLKPSNVLVTMHDDVPVPKVIDFGIAKATSARLTEKTLFTEFRQFIGTPEYMSPDQAEISGLDIDTRTDIYSLGVLLYELLTGTTPLDSEVLRTRGYAEMQRIIREVEPPIPSTRVHTMASSSAKMRSKNGSPAADSAGIGRHRRADFDALSRSLRGDLDWIVMKAIEKDRTRRYQTANELADDIRRHLENKPVEAGPPGAVYRLRKFIRRNQAMVTAASVVLLVLLLGVAASTLFAIGQASARRAEAEQRLAAENARDEARREAEHSQQVSRFLQQLATQLELGSDAPSGLSVAEVIDRGRGLFGDDHALIGTLLLTRASSLRTGGKFEEAEQAAEEALAFYRDEYGVAHPNVAAALTTLAKVQEERGDYHAAQENHRSALAMKRVLYGNESRLTADALAQLTELLCTRGSESDHEEAKELWSEAIDSYRVALGENDPTTVKQLCSFGTWLASQGYTEESIPWLEEAVARARSVLNDEDFNRFLAVNSLAQHRLLQEGDVAATIPLVEELMGLSEAMWGEQGLVTLSLRLQLVPLNAQTDEIAAAASHLRTYLELRESAAITPNVTIVYFEKQSEASLRGWLRKHPEVGRSLWGHLLADARVVINRRSDELRDLLQSGAQWLSDNGFVQDAEPVFEEVVALQREAEEVDTEALSEALVALAELRMRLEEASSAEMLARESLELRRESYPERHWLIGSSMSVLGESLAAQGRMEEAQELLHESYQILMNDPRAPQRTRSDALERIVSVLEMTGRTEEAARWRERQPVTSLLTP